MERQVEISDKFDSASETKWIAENWELAPHTREIKPVLALAALMVALVGALGGALYVLNASRWLEQMRGLYVPYESAVVHIEKLEYCRESWCFEKKRELVRERDEAWKALCVAENSEEYIRRLRNNNELYQACD